jgi:predicted nucleic acid-binding protein
MTVTLTDTGPLIAYLDPHDQWHEWSVRQWSELSKPVLTCEPVITEACFLISRYGGSPDEIMELVREGLFQIALQLSEEAASITTLLRRYADTPMSLADACLVRLAELHHNCRVLTLDRDFVRYRRHGRNVIPLLAPW